MGAGGASDMGQRRYKAEGMAKRLKATQSRKKRMAGFEAVKARMEVIGADGVHVGTVDRVVGDRIKLVKADGGQGRHKGHHHFISRGLIAEVEGDKVRLSANGDVAVGFEEEGQTAPG
jgi:hypothetical protein